jgi:hypothetical protein
MRAFFERGNKVRRGIAIASLGLFAFLMWGVIGAWVATTFTNISEGNALVFVGVPVGLLGLASVWKELPKLTD